MSKKLTLNTAGTEATVTEATATDILTTLIDPNTALTGAFGLVQKVGLVLGGMVWANKRHTNEFFNFG